MISTYHKDDMRVAVDKANREETKPVVVCDYNINMLGGDLKLFKRLLTVAIHNAMVVYRCLPNNKNMNPLKFRLSLAQGLVEKHGSSVPHPVYGRPSVEPPPKRLTERHFLECIPATRNKTRPQRKCVVCTKHGQRKESVSVVNVRQGCV
jgi:hypothetical protein